MVFDIEIKIKGIKPYRLGDLNQIEIADGYLYATIFDTRIYNLSDVEYIKILEVRHDY